MGLITKALAFLVLAVFVCTALPSPDSAGLVERVNGLAYGGIPYGSVSGALGESRPVNLQARGGPALTHRAYVSRPVYGAGLRKKANSGRFF